MFIVLHIARGPNIIQATPSDVLSDCDQNAWDVYVDEEVQK